MTTGSNWKAWREQRRATPVSVAAHSLYEQADPYTVYEPEGRLDLSGADYAAVDDRRCRVTGAKWRESTDPCVKIEGARRIGERAVLLAGAADPRFIAQHREILPAVATVVRDLVCEDTPRGLHAALPRLRRGRRAHGGAGGRTATGRSVHHGRMHRADGASAQPRWCGH